MWKNNNPLIVLNWKMNPLDLNEALSIFDFVTEKAKNNTAEIIVCSPFIYLNFLSVRLTEKKESINNIKIGAQNCFWEKGGAYTGEISSFMLKNLNCKYVILGHSERREYLEENDEMINKKIMSAISAGLKVIFCVGEKERDENKNYFNFLKQQIENGLRGISMSDFKNVIIAYEPRWAISAGKIKNADNPFNLPPIITFIRNTILKLVKENSILADEIPILYGGSVDKTNFKNFLDVGDLAGFLIGGASLKQNELKEILNNLDIIHLSN